MQWPAVQILSRIPALPVVTLAEHHALPPPAGVKKSLPDVEIGYCVYFGP
jgi:hypothetical protein